MDSAGIFPRNRIPLPRRGYSRLRDAACKASLPRRLFGGGHGALLPAALALVAHFSSSSSSTGRRDAVLYRRVLGRSLNSLASVGRQASTTLMIASMRCDPSRSTCWNGCRRSGLHAAQALPAAGFFVRRLLLQRCAHQRSNPYQPNTACFQVLSGLIAPRS